MQIYQKLFLKFRMIAIEIIMLHWLAWTKKNMMKTNDQK